ncbi:MAG: MarR family winged helix-turn-helix transcriptional regulator [Ideonella sp.]
MIKRDFSQRFGFLVNEVGRLYGRRFDQLARAELGLSRAQCRLIGVLAMHDGDAPLSQAELAERLDLTPMGVTSLCDRMAAAGWLRRNAHATDRRVKQIELLPAAYEALDKALALGDALQAQALEGLGAAERSQLMSLLRKAHSNLSDPGAT